MRWVSSSCKVRDAERLSEEDPDARSETSRIIPVPDDDIVHPPPFGLHPTLLTSLVGLATGTVLWIAFPILDYLDMEPFRLPPNSRVAFGIAGIALSGVVFNSGFMVSSSSIFHLKGQTANV